MLYRGYDLEQKTLMIGWQIAITRDGKFVRNGTVTDDMIAAVDEAEKIVDRAIAEVDIAALGAKP
jgi:ABC-type proline/glycine betaine transport system ATPase subunit